MAWSRPGAGRVPGLSEWRGGHRSHAGALARSGGWRCWSTAYAQESPGHGRGAGALAGVVTIQGPGQPPRAGVRRAGRTSVRARDGALADGASRALRVVELPDHHPDPFDRLVVARVQEPAIPLVVAHHQLSACAVDLVPTGDRAGRDACEQLTSACRSRCPRGGTLRTHTPADGLRVIDSLHRRGVLPGHCLDVQVGLHHARRDIDRCASTGCRSNRLAVLLGDVGAPADGREVA
jgi:hypothetical protein